MVELANAGLSEALDRGASLQRDGEHVALSSVQLKAPLHPPSIRKLVAFEEHVEGVMRSVSGETVIAAQWYEAPTFYFGNPHTLRATGEAISAPSGNTMLDFELEVAAVIGTVEGTDGRDLSAAAAADAIFGYTIFNDWSARDLQRREMRVNLGPCKGKDFATTLGPWIVTADEFRCEPDADGFLPLAMSVSMNGVPFGTDLLSSMSWPFAELVAYASRNSQ